MKSSKKTAKRLSDNSPIDSEMESDISEFARTTAEEYRSILIAPGGLSFLRLHRAWSKGRIDRELAKVIGSLLDGLLGIIARVSDGDTNARKQLDALERIVWPDQHSLVATDIEKIANRHTNASLARAWELRELMGRLSYLAEPKDGQSHRRALGGSINSKQTAIKKRASLDSYDRSILETVYARKGSNEYEINKELDVNGKGHITLFDLANQDLYWKKNSTLQSVALDIYLKMLADADIYSARKTLTDDLKKATEWEESHSGPETDWGFDIKTRPFSPGWKRARKLKDGKE